MAVVANPAHAQAVVPSDTANLPVPSAYLAFVNAGTQTLTIDTVGGEIGVELILPSGFYPICAKKVYAAGTTVTNIVMFWNWN